MIVVSGTGTNNTLAGTTNPWIVITSVSKAGFQPAINTAATTGGTATSHIFWIAIGT
jgi:hypothetical protein